MIKALNIYRKLRLKATVEEHQITYEDKIFKSKSKSQKGMGLCTLISKIQ